MEELSDKELTDRLLRRVQPGWGVKDLTRIGNSSWFVSVRGFFLTPFSSLSHGVKKAVEGVVYYFLVKRGHDVCRFEEPWYLHHVPLLRCVS